MIVSEENHNAEVLKRKVMAELGRHPFQPAWWLRGGHAHTVWSPPFRQIGDPGFTRERWETPDGDFLDVYSRKVDPESPWVLLLHGLEGSVRSKYLRGFAHRFAGIGWNVAAMEQRSCSGEINLARRMYHSGETTDLAHVVAELSHRTSATRIYVVGVSLTANQTAKWLGETGDEAHPIVRGAACISPPFDLTVSGPATDLALGGFYTRRFLKTLIPKAIAKENQYPGSLNLELIRRSRTFAEFDAHATAPLHGFRDHLDYWGRVSCGQFLQGVRRPTLLIAAEDDPFNPGSTHPRELAARSPWLYPQFTKTGGHVGFVSGRVPWSARYWSEEQTARFFQALEVS